MNLAITSEVEPKQFYRRLEMVFANLETAGPARVFAARFAREFGEHFSGQLPIQSIVAFDLLGHDPYVNAGHPHPLLLDSSGFHDLNTSGMILGPYADSVYASGTALLAPGALLALFTDGVLEHSNSHGKEFGTHEVKRWMLDWQHENVISAMKDLFASLRLFGQGQAFRDDMTAILIRRRAEP